MSRRLTYLLTHWRRSVTGWTWHAWWRDESNTAAVRRTSWTRQNSTARSQTTAASRSRLSQTTVRRARSPDDVILSWPITALRCCTQPFARLAGVRFCIITFIFFPTILSLNDWSLKESDISTERVVSLGCTYRERLRASNYFLNERHGEDMGQIPDI